jgi:ABC-type multidrug transport system ATPase subunit
MEAVALHNIKKTYNGGNCSLLYDDISLSIEKGELFG